MFRVANMQQTKTFYVIKRSQARQKFNIAAIAAIAVKMHDPGRF
jgi:hypothetical protein